MPSERYTGHLDEFLDEEIDLFLEAFSMASSFTYLLSSKKTIGHRIWTISPRQWKRWFSTLLRLLHLQPLESIDDFITWHLAHYIQVVNLPKFRGWKFQMTAPVLRSILHWNSKSFPDFINSFRSYGREPGNHSPTWPRQTRILKFISTTQYLSCIRWY